MSERMNMDAKKNYIAQHEGRFVKELFDWLKIPSVSADPDFRDDVFESAEFIEARLKEAGADYTEICPTPGYPVVYAEKVVDPKAPTILIYGHYDVQPADPYDLWTVPPFQPEIRDEKIYARGAADDKGQTYMHVKAMEMLLQQNALKHNLKFIIEGEEEVGSVHLAGFLEANRERLSCDLILISDTSMFSMEHPSVTIGLRGLCYMEVEVVGPSRDLHSGIYGGAVANPANVLCRMISSLHDDRHRITIPGFYDDVIELSAYERQLLARAPFDEQAYLDSIGISSWHGEEGYSPMELTSIRPTLDVNGIWSGYMGEGAKTVLPSVAGAKISMRLVPNQNPERMAQLFQKHLESIAPPYVKVKVKAHHGGFPVVTPIDSMGYQAAEQAILKTFGKPPIPLRTGGSIPIVALFEDILESKTILMGFGLDTDAIHSPNEHFGLFNFKIGIETIGWFHEYYSEMVVSGKN